MTLTTHKGCLLSPLALFLLTFFSIVCAHEQSSEQYSLSKNVLSNGGDQSQSSHYQMVASVGQYATGKSTANGNMLHSGFYAPRSTRSSKPHSACGGVTEGLVACYPFDGNAKDGSGNGNHGSEHGGLNYAAGKIGQAAQFDGIDDYIQITPKSEVSKIGDFTIVTWVLLEDWKKQNPDRQYIFDGHSHSNTTTGDFYRPGFSLIYDHRGNREEIHNAIMYNYTNRFSEQNTQVSIGKSWHQLLYMRKGKEDFTYFDGELLSATYYRKEATNVPLNMNHNWFIGTFSGNNPHYSQFNYSFFGLLDDLRIYNRALSESEIKALYNLEKKVEPPKQPEACDLVKDGLVACYPFDGNAKDGSGNGNDGTVHGASLTEDRFGNADSAYKFDGIDDYIEIPKGHKLNITGPLTLSAWVNPISYDTTKSNEKTIVWGQVSYYLSLYRPQKSLANYRYGVSNAGYHHTTENSVPIGKNTLITGVWDGQTLKQFINCKLVNTVENVKGIATSTRGVVRIGKEDYWGNRAFNGTIDDIRIYNRALSESEIKTLYNPENDSNPNCTDE
jgi:hypothetical protein